MHLIFSIILFFFVGRRKILSTKLNVVQSCTISMLYKVSVAIQTLIVIAASSQAISFEFSVFCSWVFQVGINKRLRASITVVFQTPPRPPISMLKEFARHGVLSPCEVNARSCTILPPSFNTKNRTSRDGACFS